MANTHTGQRYNRGLTLIELLVVICIIAILASILFPIFSTARNASRKAVCQSNLRQFAVAFELYVQDWEGLLPTPGGLVGDWNYWAQDNGGGLEPYLKCAQMGSESVWCCPSYDVETDGTMTHVPRTYSMNSFLRDPCDITPSIAGIAILKGIQKDRIPYPADTILLFEGIAEDRTCNIPNHGTGYVARCGDWSMAQGYAPRNHYQSPDKPVHGTVNNYLMCDGHVISRRPDKYPFAPSPENNQWFVRRYR